MDEWGEWVNDGHEGNYGMKECEGVKERMGRKEGAGVRE